MVVRTIVNYAFTVACTVSLTVLIMNLWIGCSYYPPFREDALEIFAQHGVVGFKYVNDGYVYPGWFWSQSGTITLGRYARELRPPYYGRTWGPPHHDRSYGVYSVYVPLWCLLPIFAAIPLENALAARRRRLRLRKGLCRNCGYDLQGQGDQRCPECGTPFEGSRGVEHAS